MLNLLICPTLARVIINTNKDDNNKQGENKKKEKKRKLGLLKIV